MTRTAARLAELNARRVAPDQRGEYYINGGPWKGLKIRAANRPGFTTLVISVGGSTGFYARATAPRRGGAAGVLEWKGVQE